MGIFGKLFGALKKTKDNLSGKLRVLFSKNKLGDEFYEELEEILISSDVSVATAEEVVERVKEKAIEGKLKDEAYVTDLLRGILTEILEEAEVPDLSYPCVIMLVGVNGVGKPANSLPSGRIGRRSASSSTRREATPRRSFSTRYPRQRRRVRTWSLWIRRAACTSKTIS